VPRRGPATSGEPDSSFGNAGRKAINFGGTDIAHAVLVQSNRRIVVAGGGAAAGSFCVARLLPDGRLDTTFRTTGKRTIGFGRPNESAFAAALQPDGKIVLAGDSNLRVAVARLNRNGSLDTTFSGDGKLTFSWGAISRAMAIVVMPNGKLLLAGFSGPEGGNIEVSRLQPGGALDAGFGEAGRASVDFGGTEFGSAMALQANGRILVAGRSSAAGAVLVRLRANGALDPDFDGDGRVTLPGGGGATAVLVQPDRKIVVAGTTSTSQMAITRLNPNGSLDAAFGTNGTTTVDFGSIDDFANAAVLQPDGKIVVCGYSQGDEDIAVVRLDPDGSLDPSFGSAGKATAGFGVATFGNAVALQANGRIVVAGQRSGSDDFAVARLTG
jgi:uncharacterized delta-60 repeat protein